MDNQPLTQLQQRLDALVQCVPDESIEFWFARDLLEPLGYANWENFLSAIQRAMTSCESTGYESSDHFRGVTKMIEIDKGGQRRINPEVLPAEEDIRMLERRVKSEEKKIAKQAPKLPADYSGADV